MATEYTPLDKSREIRRCLVLRKKRGKGMLACSTASFTRGCRCAECVDWYAGYVPDRTWGKDCLRCPETGLACSTAYARDKCRCSACRLYRNAYERGRHKIRREDPEYAAYIRNQRLLWTYGISQKDYEQLLAEQSGVCKLCGAAPNDGKNLDIDHVHDSDPVIVRGLLCSSCNAKLHNGVGPDWFIRAAKYVDNDGDVSFEFNGLDI